MSYIIYTYKYIRLLLYIIYIFPLRVNSCAFVGNLKVAECRRKQVHKNIRSTMLAIILYIPPLQVVLPKTREAYSRDTILIIIPLVVRRNERCTVRSELIDRVSRRGKKKKNNER